MDRSAIQHSFAERTTTIIYRTVLRTADATWNVPATFWQVVFNLPHALNHFRHNERSAVFSFEQFVRLFGIAADELFCFWIDG